MIFVTLNQDLVSLAREDPESWQPVVADLDRFTHGARLESAILRAAQRARLDYYRLLALLLKADWERTDPSTTSNWQPWQAPASFSSLLVGYGARAEPMDITILEQCVLHCHLEGATEVRAYATLHEQGDRLLSEAAPDLRQAFLHDKREWLLAERQFDELSDVKQQLLEELRHTKMHYMLILGEVFTRVTNAAYDLALMRYRLALGDPELSPEQFEERLQVDLNDATGASLTSNWSDALRLALRESPKQLRENQRTLAQLSHLWAAGNVRSPTPEEVAQVNLLVGKLRNLLRFVALGTDDPIRRSLRPEHLERLEYIYSTVNEGWKNGRVHFSYDQLVNFADNLRDWIEEVTRILRNAKVRAPLRLLHGDSLHELHADLRIIMERTQRQLHEVREEICIMEFDPQHEEFRRVMAMPEAEREALREQMNALADAWTLEASELARQMADLKPAITPAPDQPSAE